MAWSQTEIIVLGSLRGREKEYPGHNKKELNSLGKFAIRICYKQEKCINLQSGTISCIFIYSHYNSINTCFEGNITQIMTQNQSKSVRKWEAVISVIILKLNRNSNKKENTVCFTIVPTHYTAFNEGHQMTLKRGLILISCFYPKGSWGMEICLHWSWRPVAEPCWKVSSPVNWIFDGATTIGRSRCGNTLQV